MVPGPVPARPPKRNRSIPAQAIIAALSVQSRKGGATNRTRSSVQSRSSEARIRLFAATPPATAKAGSLGVIAR